MLQEKVIGFVDWHTAVIASGASGLKRDRTIAEKALRHIERVISEYLAAPSGRPPCRVRLRLYSGWWSGKTPTDYRRGVDELRERYAKTSRRFGNCVFDGGNEGIQTGDRLACGSNRLARKEGVHLLNMVRYVNGSKREKMADTGLISDLLILAWRKEADRYIVVSDDDDVLPGLFSAEAVGVRVKLLRRSNIRVKYMAHAKDLVHNYESVFR